MIGHGQKAYVYLENGLDIWKKELWMVMSNPEQANRPYVANNTLSLSHICVLGQIHICLYYVNKYM